MKVAELIARLTELPQDADVFAVNEYENYIPIKHADYVTDDEYGSGPHIQLSEYGASQPDDA